MHWLGPGLVYAKLQSDSAVYLVQARHLWEDGAATNFALAPGLPNIVYTPLPAWLRAVLFGLTNDPATLVWLLQLQNLLILGLLAGVSQSYLLRRLRGPHVGMWSMVPWCYIAMTYNPWVLNAFMPMGDHLFALLTMTVLLLATTRPPANRGRRVAQLLLTLVLVMLAGLQKVTGLALLPVVLLANVRRGNLPGLLLASGLVLYVTLGLYGDVHLRTFAAGASFYLTGQSPLTVVLDTGINLLVAAVPNQLIPNFSYLLIRDFTATHAVGRSAMTLANLPWIVVGLAVTTLVLSGAWRERARLTPELLLLACTVPIYAMASNSTSRYLASVQPVYWVLALGGGVPLLRRFQRFRLPIAALGTTFALIVGGLMSVNMARSFSAFSSEGPDELLHFLRHVSNTFEQGQKRIATLLQQSADARFVLISDDIRWYALDGVRYIATQDAAAAACMGTPIYTVSACDARNCPRSALIDEAGGDRLRVQGLVATPVYVSESTAAVFRIDQWRAQPDQACQLK